jgi:hypothetical protein
MKLSEVTIAWTPNRETFPAGFRGKVRIFQGAAVDEAAPFARRAGRCDSRALDGRIEVRQAYALMIAFAMSERDGLDVLTVHRAMLGIEEYVAGCAQEVLPEGIR